MAKEPRKAALAFIFVTVLLDITGLGIIIPVVPSLIMELTGEGISKAAQYGGWLMFVYAVSQFSFAPVIGSLSDHFGRRPVLLISLAGFGIDYIITGFSMNILWLFGARLVAGITGASITTASAYIADISSPEKKAQNFGLIGAAFGVGFIVGPVIGGLLGEFGPRVPFFAAAALTFLNFLYGYFVLPESLAPEHRRKFNFKRANPIGALRQIKKFPAITGLILIFFLLYIAQHAVQSTWTYYTMEKFSWTERMVGISLGVVGFFVGLVQGGLTRVVIPKLGEIRSVYFGLTFSVLGLIGFAFAPNGWFMLSVIAVYACGGFAGPALQGIISNRVPANQQGELQGVLTSLVSFTAIFGPPMMANLFSYFSSGAAVVHFPGAPFLTGALLVFGALIASVRVLRRLKPAGT